MKVCSLIMAGGEEMRFGPVKRYVGSKTTLQLNGQEEILLETIFRCELISERKEIYIVTNEDQYQIYKKILKTKCGEKYNFPQTNFLMEPQPKRTAPCILFSALKLKKKYPNEDIVLCIFPSDHDISNEGKFRNTIERAIDIASRMKKLVTIGISPTFPSTAYGYIKFRKESHNNDSYYDVIRFKEKPEEDDAQKFIDSKEYFWNSGIFVWHLDVILEQYKKHFQEAYNEFTEISNTNYMDEKIQKDAWARAYNNVKKISIDYAILQETEPENIVVVNGDFNWQDIGKWDALLAIFSEKDNIVDVEIVGVDKMNKTIYSTGKAVYKNGKKFTFDFSSSSYVWLHCNEDDKTEIQRILSGYNKYEINQFESIEIDQLIKALKESNQIGDTLQNDDRDMNPIIFISHKSDDKLYADIIRNALVGLGVANNQLIYTSHPQHKVPAGENIYDYLRQHITAKVFMIILWSDKYLESVACLNEMGAAWVTRCEYFNFFVPGFNARNPKRFDCALDPNKKAIVLSGDKMCESGIRDFFERIIAYVGIDRNVDREELLLAMFIQELKNLGEKNNDTQ